MMITNVFYIFISENLKMLLLISIDILYIDKIQYFCVLDIWGQK